MLTLLLVLGMISIVFGVPLYVFPSGREQWHPTLWKVPLFIPLLLLSVIKIGWVLIDAQLPQLPDNLTAAIEARRLRTEIETDLLDFEVNHVVYNRACYPTIYWEDKCWGIETLRKKYERREYPRIEDAKGAGGGSDDDAGQVLRPGDTYRCEDGSIFTASEVVSVSKIRSLVGPGQPVIPRRRFGESEIFQRDDLWQLDGGELRKVLSTRSAAQLEAQFGPGRGLHIKRGATHEGHDQLTEEIKRRWDQRDRTAVVLSPDESFSILRDAPRRHEFIADAIVTALGVPPAAAATGIGETGRSRNDIRRAEGVEDQLPDRDQLKREWAMAAFKAGIIGRDAAERVLNETVVRQVPLPPPF